MNPNNHKQKRLFLLVFLITAVLCAPNRSTADRTFRCQGRIVEIGATKATVLSKCGEPDKIDQWEEDPDSYISQIYDYEKERYRLPKLIKGPVLMELWTYDLGFNRFIRYLYFQNGKLYKIKLGEKGGG